MCARARVRERREESSREGDCVSAREGAEYSQTPGPQRQLRRKLHSASPRDFGSGDRTPGIDSHQLDLGNKDSSAFTSCF